MKLLILAPYPPGRAASQRFRIEHYISYFESQGTRVTYRGFLGKPTWDILYRKGHLFRKLLGFAAAFFGRWLTMTSIWRYDAVLVHREAAPFGPPIFEFLIAKVFRKRLIFDMDDAIWLPNHSGNNTWFSRVKNTSRIQKICRWSTKVTCGNAFLAEYASQFNPDVEVFPTVVDTTYHRPVVAPRPKCLVIGWTGSHSTIKYLDQVLPVLDKLREEFEFEFRVISDQAPSWSRPYLRFVKWNRDSEVRDLMGISIGIMPLVDDDWARGKCGFKAIQYMALSIPSVVSDVGVNPHVVDHNSAGRCCSTPEDWEHALRELITDESVRAKVGQAGRKRVHQMFSVKSQREAFYRAVTGDSTLQLPLREALRRRA